MLTDVLEGTLNSNPANPDTDGDGLSDYVEIHSFIATESDAPFGGTSNLGEVIVDIPLIFHRFPMAWDQTTGNSVFEGQVEDGAYRYEIVYELTFRLAP